MKGYKAFAPGMICRGKQYAENTVFEEAAAVICESGMHFCKEPLDVLDHYPLVNDDGEITEFAEVEALDEPITDDNKKYCTKKLKIGAKISFAKLVQASVNFDLKKNVPVEDTKIKTTSKDFAQIGSSGDSAQIGSSGNFAQIGSSGDSTQIGSSGDFAQIGSSGDFAQIGSSGDSARIGASGLNARIGSSGDFASIGSSGDFASIGASGRGVKINSTGKYAVICCAGHNSIAKGKKGSWITLSEWGHNEEENADIPICVKTEQIDGERIKEDVYYKLKKGEFVEVK